MTLKHRKPFKSRRTGLTARPLGWNSQGVQWTGLDRPGHTGRAGSRGTGPRLGMPRLLCCGFFDEFAGWLPPWLPSAGRSRPRGGHMDGPGKPVCSSSCPVFRGHSKCLSVLPPSRAPELLLPALVALPSRGPPSDGPPARALAPRPQLPRPPLQVAPRRRFDKFKR